MRTRTKVLSAILLLLAGGAAVGPGIDSDKWAVTASSAAEEAAQGAIFFEGVPYAGTFSDGSEDGLERFTVTEADAPFVSVEGTRSGDSFQGEAEIVMRDGSVITASFQNGVLSGAALRTWSSGETASWRYSKGCGSGRVTRFAADGTISGIDRYYDNRLISEWEALAEESDVSYADLLADPDSWYYTPLLVEGEVTDVLEDTKTCYLLVKNKDGQSFLCKYQNTGVSPALAKSVEEGEQVRVCGLFDSCEVLDLNGLYPSCLFTDLSKEADLNDFVLDSSIFTHALARVEIQNNDVYSTLPVLYVLSLQTQEDQSFAFDQLQEDQAVAYEYEQLLTWPGYFAGFLLNDTVQVRQTTVNYEKNTASLLLQKQGEDGLYYATMNLEKIETVPAVGDTIQIQAKLNGLYKLEQRITEDNYDEVTYVLVPCLVLKQVEEAEEYEPAR